ncbi:MAG: hypothetical protein JRH06_05545 [Deltaproteobacteria bacterium]|nr:hypothetical protein [Deltaproteobacteria bacterium]MBW2137002.1 hypothetical protein [Deltaproteobacteria bacterium]
MIEDISCHVQDWVKGADCPGEILEMGKRHRVVIAEDHTILREGLKSLLEGSTS